MPPGPVYPAWRGSNSYLASPKKRLLSPSIRRAYSVSSRRSRQLRSGICPSRIPCVSGSARSAFKPSANFARASLPSRLVPWSRRACLRIAACRQAPRHYPMPRPRTPFGGQNPGSPHDWILGFSTLTLASPLEIRGRPQAPFPVRASRTKRGLPAPVLCPPMLPTRRGRLQPAPVPSPQQLTQAPSPGQIPREARCTPVVRRPQPHVTGCTRPVQPRLSTA